MLHELGDAVGIEIEVPTIAIDGSWPFHRKVPRGWVITRDGSCTFNRPTFEGMAVETDEQLYNMLPLRPTGGEFISPVYSLQENFTKLVDEVAALFGLMEKSGEYISTLTSVHVHVYFGQLPPVKKFKSLLEVCRMLEAPIFRLSVAELLKHRGIYHNDFQYCRPLTGDGPQFVQDGMGKWRRCFDLSQILSNARTSLEMLAAWGRADDQPRKWIPPRYYWVNPCPLVTQGTIEFRAFNQTFDVVNVAAWVWLCAAIVKTAYGRTVDPSHPDFPLGLTKPVGDSAEFRFADLFSIVDPSFIPDEHIVGLERLWTKADWQPGIKGPQVNHLSKRGDVVHLESLRDTLLTPVVPRAYIDEIWNSGYDNHQPEEDF